MRSELRKKLPFGASLFLLLAVCPTARAITIFKVAATEDHEAYPSVSGNTVVWQDDRDGNWDIYGAILDGPEVTTTTEP
ncbi:MAG: hypothetical protein KBE65_00070 [Phycisphaerae bacterium]|nr:hypothetical protein [Phycisphaerae bacterium]